MSRELIRALRQALLMIVDALEKELPDEYPITTAQIRDLYKRGALEVKSG